MRLFFLFSTCRSGIAGRPDVELPVGRIPGRRNAHLTSFVFRIPRAAG